MGELIVIKRPVGASRRAEPAQGDAEILFFTGVRYVRMAETPDALASVIPKRRATKPRRNSRKSDDIKSA